ncbi:Sperm acrosome-associated protein 7 [Lemmus lemmus]
MAVNKGVKTLISVFLLCCWHGTVLQSINSTSGKALTCSSILSQDEILSQEILEPNTSAVVETPQTTKASTQTTAQSKEKNIGIDDNYQEDGSENYHELLENLELSTMNRSTVQKLHKHSPHTKPEPHFSFDEKKSSNNDKHRKMSILDRILQNIGRYEDSLELRGKWPRIRRSPAGQR